ncbi:hypothetical protein [Desulfatiglans anilini]|uniref:hypothetical protein n=1 Tax=Desulfatiglans anilini TaxID=90728 RepID=UPI0004277786|nr:hypothetical protein [Desulfatiglans anilini]
MKDRSFKRHTIRRVLAGIAAAAWLILFSGCSEDERLKREIREDARAGRFDEAVAKARDYFAADKLTLMVLLETIAIERNRAEKATYRHHLALEAVEWEKTDSGISLSGGIRNSGDRTLTGYGIKVTLLQNIERKETFFFSRIKQIPAGGLGVFRYERKTQAPFDHVLLEIHDFGIEDD